MTIVLVPDREAAEGVRFFVDWEAYPQFSPEERTLADDWLRSVTKTVRARKRRGRS